jgi:outer membrane protein assembly factor BamD
MGKLYVGLVLVLATGLAACGGNRRAAPATNAQPDRFLMDRGNEALKERNWLEAREYYRQVVDNYPQSPVRPDAKLGIGETYLGEGSVESLVLAANEFREFLTFYPTNPNADQAQYKLAMTHVRQMKAPARDQTATKEALKEFQAFFDRFPTSPLTPEVKKQWREARDRLSEASYLVGLHYYRQRWYPGAVDRFREVLRDDPEYTRRDAVYFYLAESLAKSQKQPEGNAAAAPYFERVINEFPQGEHTEEAKKRLAEMKVDVQSSGAR